MSDQDTTKYKVPNQILQKLSDVDFLNNIYGIGEKSVEQIAKFCKNHSNVLYELTDYGVDFGQSDAEHTKNNIGPNSSQQVHFCITGTFDVSRNDIVEIFERQGFVSDSNITNQTQFLIAGDKAGSKKSKAIEKNLKIYENTEDLCKDFEFVRSIFVSKSQPREISLFE